MGVILTDSFFGLPDKLVSSIPIVDVYSCTMATEIDLDSLARSLL